MDSVLNLDGIESLLHGENFFEEKVCDDVLRLIFQFASRSISTLINCSRVNNRWRSLIIYKKNFRNKKEFEMNKSYDEMIWKGCFIQSIRNIFVYGYRFDASDFLPYHILDFSFLKNDYPFKMVKEIDNAPFRFEYLKKIPSSSLTDKIILESLKNHPESSYYDKKFLFSEKESDKFDQIQKKIYLFYREKCYKINKFIYNHPLTKSQKTVLFFNNMVSFFCSIGIPFLFFLCVMGSFVFCFLKLDSFISFNIFYCFIIPFLVLGLIFCCSFCFLNPFYNLWFSDNIIKQRCILKDQFIFGKDFKQKVFVNSSNTNFQIISVFYSLFFCMIFTLVLCLSIYILLLQYSSNFLSSFSIFIAFSIILLICSPFFFYWWRNYFYDLFDFMKKQMQSLFWHFCFLLLYAIVQIVFYGVANDFIGEWKKSKFGVWIVFFPSLIFLIVILCYAIYFIFEFYKNKKRDFKIFKIINDKKKIKHLTQQRNFSASYDWTRNSIEDPIKNVLSDYGVSKQVLSHYYIGDRFKTVFDTMLVFVFVLAIILPISFFLFISFFLIKFSSSLNSYFYFLYLLIPIFSFIIPFIFSSFFIPCF